MPRFCSATSAICVGVGIAVRVLISFVRCLPWAKSVQDPSGPRKSGIPADVEIPAPVKTMKCLLFLIWSASFWALRSTSEGDSKRSSAAILGALSAMMIQIRGKGCFLDVDSYDRRKLNSC
jgi:hypothetical protein